MALLFGAALAGCASYQSVPIGENHDIQSRLQAGDRVRITTLAGDELEFAVTAINTDEIAGEGVRVQLPDAAMVEVRRFNKRRVFIVLGAVVGGLLLLDVDDCDGQVGCPPLVF